MSLKLPKDFVGYMGLNKKLFTQGENETCK
jgi:hypothetical protein